MSEKPIITKEQAEAIEEMKKTGIPVTWKSDGWYVKRDRCLNDLHFDKFIKALYIGYEVEPDYSAGDWVLLKDGTIARIINTEDCGIKSRLRLDVYLEERRGQITIEKGEEIENVKRRATPSEIAAEKERRWWRKHGRDVWELKKGDLLKNTHNYLTYEVVDVNQQGGIAFINDIGFRDKISIVAYYKVVCFAENRLDVSK